MSGATIISAVAPVVAAAVVIRSARRRRTARVEAELRSSLGLAIDLVAVVVGAGGTIHQAVGCLAVHGSPVASPSFARAQQRAAEGRLLVDALAEIGPELGPAYHSLLGALIITETDGAPLASLLDRLASDAEQQARWEAEAAGGRLTVSVLVPLVVCLLPAVVIGAVIPVVIVALRQLGS
jgi:Flp pilus assembly protein TadB